MTDSGYPTQNRNSVIYIQWNKFIPLYIRNSSEFKTNLQNAINISVVEGTSPGPFQIESIGHIDLNGKTTTLIYYSITTYPVEH